MGGVGRVGKCGMGLRRGNGGRSEKLGGKLKWVWGVKWGRMGEGKGLWGL